MIVLDDRESTLLKVGLIRLMIIGLLTFALINNQKYLILLLVVLLAFIYGARLWSKFSLKQLYVFSSFDRQRIFPGEEVHLNVAVENRKLVPVWIRVIVPIPVDFNDDSNPYSNICEQGLLWYQSVQLNWQFAPQRRGIYQLGSPQLAVGDLMGLYPRIAKDNQPLPLDLIVYPRLVPLRTFTYIKKDLFGIPGAKTPIEDPIYLLGTRDYQAGSPSRYIHWTASARLNRLQERIFEPSSQAKVLFILDVTPFVKAGAFDLFERNLEGLASLAVECDRYGYATGFVTNGSIRANRPPALTIARNNRQSMLILETLAGLDMNPGQNLGNTLRAMTGLDNGVSCVLFTLSKKEPITEEIGILIKRKFSITTVYCDNSDVDDVTTAGEIAIPLNSLLFEAPSL